MVILIKNSNLFNKARKMSKLSVSRTPLVEIDQRLQTEVDAFCEANGGTVFHEVELNKLAAQAYGTELSYFIARKDGKLAGCMPCHSFRKGGLVFSHSNLSSYELPYGGWVFDRDVTNIRELLGQTKLGGFESLQVKSNIEVYPGQQAVAGKLRVTTLKTVLVDLRQASIEDLFEGLKHSQKQKIRRAGKLGVETYILDPGDFHIFMELETDLKQKAGLKPRDESFYRQVYGHYHAQGRAACTVATYQGEPISAGIMLANKNYSVGWLAGRKTGIPNNLYQNELLIWEQIRWAKEFGSGCFDLGAIDEVKLPHLLRIKLSFCGQVRPFYSYSIKPLPFRIAKRLRGVTK